MTTITSTTGINRVTTRRGEAVTLGLASFLLGHERQNEQDACNYAEKQLSIVQLLQEQKLV